jgi:DNA-binding GntR family transcriptional regulator
VPAEGSLDRQSVVVVRDRIRDAILRGELRPGQRTSQVALVRDLKVGRTPLREALRMLQNEGLVVSAANRRVQIAELSPEDAEELYIMRISLEAVAIAITVPTLTPTDIAELEGLMAQMDHYIRHGDRAGFRIPHRLFHERLIASAGERPRDHIMLLFDHGDRYRMAFGNWSEELPYEKRSAEHRAILDAAAAGQPDLAAQRLVAHYVSTVRLIFAGLQTHHDLARLRAAIRIVAPGAESELDSTLSRERTSAA